jgi:glycosyltransferase involved in cell wall biosynthesis
MNPVEVESGKELSPELSIIIGTWNRPAYVRKALRSLCVQTLAPERFEVITVDNSTNEETRAVCNEPEFSSPRFRYLRSAIVSGNAARDIGTAYARGAYVAFLDDDAVASPGWTAEIVRSFETLGPKAGCLGGPSDLILEAKRPAWLSPWLMPFLGKMDKGEQLRRLGSSEMLFGLNMAFRKNALLATGIYGKTLDRGTADLVSNSEYPLQRRLEELGYDRFYVPGMRVGHHVTPSRLRPDWTLRRAYWQGVSDVRLRRTFGIRQPPAFARAFALSPARAAKEASRLLLPTASNAFLLLAWMSMRLGIAHETIVGRKISKQ